MRRLRYVPEGGALVEVTCRTLQSRFLLRPNQAVNDIGVGVLDRAQRKYPIAVCAFVFTSNHFHLLLDVDDALQLSRFMSYVNSNLARKIGRLVGWRDKIWSRRYQAIVISSEAAAQTERLRYILAHGVKEGLVERVTDWPGVHCVRALLAGETLEGYWHDGTQEYAARRRGEDLDPMSYASLAKKSKKSPAPLFHATSKLVRRELYEMYAWFLGAFREASEKLRRGDRTVQFPAGSFPPALPFVAG